MRRIKGSRRTYLKDAERNFIDLPHGWKVPLKLEVDKEGIVPPMYFVRPHGDYMLALQVEDEPGFPELEYFMRSLARACGFAVTADELVQLADDTTALLYEVPRFNGLLGDPYLSSRFSSRESVSSYLEIARVIAHDTNYPMFELQDFLSQILFAYVTGNRELGVDCFVYKLSREDSPKRLGPAFEFFPSRFVDEYEKDDLALDFGCRRSKLGWEDVLDFARRLNLSEQQCRNRVEGLKTKLEKRFDAVLAACPLPEEMRAGLKPFVFSRLKSVIPPAQGR